MTLPAAARRSGSRSSALSESVPCHARSAAESLFTA
jgi:hypothetical protein